MHSFGGVARRAVVLAIAAVVIGLGAGIGAARIVLRHAQREATDELRVLAGQLAACNADPARWVGAGDPAVFAYDGSTFAASNPAAPSFMGPRSLAVGETHVRSPVTPFGPSTIVLRVSERGPCSFLQRHWPRRAPATLVQTVGFSAFGIALALTLTLGVLGIVRPLLRSITRVAASASQVGRPDGYRAPTQLESSELERIVAALSSSHARIVAAEQAASERLHALERHLGQVAHDLRTPLTALQLSVEEALELSDDSAAKGPMTNALVESVYLAGLTENLRLAARMRETGSFGGEAWRVDLREIVERVCSRMRILARRKSMSFRVELSEHPVLADCSPLAVERAVSNIIENAVVHGYTGGTVQVRLTCAAGSFRLSVDDDGPGLQRSDTRIRVGSGLGLRITRDVASEAGWVVRTEALEPVGSRVLLEGHSAACPSAG